MSSTFGVHITSQGFSPATYGALISLNGVLVVLFELPLTTITRRFAAPRVMALGYVLIGFGFALNVWARSGALDQLRGLAPPGLTDDELIGLRLNHPRLELRRLPEMIWHCPRCGSRQVALSYCDDDNDEMCGPCFERAAQATPVTIPSASGARSLEEVTHG